MTRPISAADGVLAAWRRHSDILLLLLDGVPAAGWTAVPTGSRGRDVARQFAHLDRVRRGWLHFHRTGRRPALPRVDKGAPPAKAVLRKALAESAKEVAGFLADAFQGEARPRMFGGDPVRWFAYLVAHESHHRGQIMIALKQAGHRLPDRIALQGLWGRWISGR